MVYTGGHGNSLKFFFGLFRILVEHGRDFVAGEFVHDGSEFGGVFDVSDVGDAEVVFPHDFSEVE